MVRWLKTRSVILSLAFSLPKTLSKCTIISTAVKRGDGVIL